MKFGQWVVGSDNSGLVSVVAPVTTAAYFGWDKAFPEFHLAERVRPDGTTYRCNTFRAAKSMRSGGAQLRICRAASKDGQPAGKTHQFRMRGAWSRKHLVELARVAGDKFEWMENTRYKRVNREIWLSLVA